MRRNPLAPGGPHLPGQLRIEQEPLGQLGKRHTVSDRSEVSGFAMRNELAIGRNVAGHDR